MPRTRPNRFTIAVVQMALSGDPEKNLAAALAWTVRAARKGAQVVCLPELFRTRYFCQREESTAFDLAEPIPGPSTAAFAQLARKRRLVVIVPVFERRAAGIFHNSAAVIDTDGKIAGVYRKMHIPDDPAYYEKFYFTPGDLGFKAFPTQAGKLGTLICWDQWFPEAARLVALQGAEVLFFPTAIGWHPREKKKYGACQREAWQTIQRAHAIANGVYVAAVNRVGLERPPGGGAGLEFWGSSFICDPFGVTLAQAAPDKEELLLAVVERGRLEEVRRHWPFLRDRRIDAYGGLERRWLDS